jgi:Amt family ammonium transporter
MVINGLLAGLVGVTASCAWINIPSSAIIGFIAGVLVVFSVGFFDKLKIDDPVGATSVHLVCGVWGTLAVGLFSIGPNIVLRGGIPLYTTVLLSTIFWLVLKSTLGIRVTPEEEMEGLDISEHGMEAYHGFRKEAEANAVPGISGGPGSVFK